MIKHGHWAGNRKSPTYTAWDSMIQRCCNPKSRAYPGYGGRGIAVCDRWLKFEDFLADMGERPDEMTIERVNNDKGYSPENCKWATRKEQSNNTRRNRHLSHCGLTLTVTQWADRLGVRAGTITTRLERGWPIEFALSTKMYTGCNANKHRGDKDMCPEHDAEFDRQALRRTKS